MFLNLKATSSAIHRVLLGALLLMVCGTMMAQNKITGTVKDSKGEPLVGVSVLEVGTQNGTMTDAQGNYSLTVGPKSHLRFSYVGFQTLQVSSDKAKHVILRDDDQSLNEVVVVGYGTMRRKDVTSSITSLKAEDLNQGVVSSPGELLEGKVPGLVVTSTGDPNGEPSLTLRGASTLREGAAMQPYYVIDGVPGVDLNLIAPDDIESIDVLRDATATAIYGSKAANGVIIITTKKGRKGAARVSYNGHVAFQTVAKRLDMASASDIRNFAKANNFEPVGDEGADTDWQDEVLRTGFSQNHYLAVSGGSEKSNYNVALNYRNREGVVRGFSNERLNGRALAQSTVLNDRLKLSLGVNASRFNGRFVPRVSGQLGAGLTNAMTYYNPMQPVRNEDGSWYRSYGVTNYYNPVSMIHEDFRKIENKRLQITGNAQLKIIDGLTWTANFSYENKQRNSNEYHSTKSQVVDNNGQAYRATYSSNKKVFETYGNYDRTFADKHHFALMLGYSWEESRNDDGFGVTVHDFYNNAVSYHNLTYANAIDGINALESGNDSRLRMISFYGRVNYSYASKYNFQATVRRDGSSAFGKNNRWGTFPSVSAAWRLSEEKFIRDLNVFNNLSLHLGYGVSGNSLGFDAYSARETYGVTGWFQYTDAAGNTTNYHTIGATHNANPNLKWERTGMFNIGLDFSFFNNRLNGTIEYYDKRTSDLIYDYDVSTNRYPFSKMYANVGDITNKGVELSLNAIPVQTSDFRWTTTLNLSHNSNKVTKISNQTYSVPYISPEASDCLISGNTGVKVQRITEGSPIGQFFLYEWAGYDENGLSQFYVHDPVTGERTGETTTKPQETDQVKKGSAQPKLSYGWNNTLSYKRWSLNLFFRGVLGNKIFNAQRAQLNSISLLSQGKNVLKECLTDQRYGDANAQTPSDRYLESGSYLRLATASLSYDFGAIGTWVKDISVYATCNNVFTITGFKGTDPEVSLGGLTPGIERYDTYYPQTRTFMMGVKVNF